MLLAALLALALPSPGNMAGNHERDVQVTARVEWHGIREFWEVDQPRVTGSSTSRLVNIGGWFTNSFFLSGSDSKTVRFALETLDGDLVQERNDGTGKGKRTGSDAFPSVVFLRIEPGSYVLRAQILEEDGRVLSESATTIVVTREGAT